MSSRRGAITNSVGRPPHCALLFIPHMYTFPSAEVTRSFGVRSHRGETRSPGAEHRTCTAVAYLSPPLSVPPHSPRARYSLCCRLGQAAACGVTHGSPGQVFRTTRTPTRSRSPSVSPPAHACHPQQAARQCVRQETALGSGTGTPSCTACPIETRGRHLHVCGTSVAPVCCRQYPQPTCAHYGKGSSTLDLEHAFRVQHGGDPMKLGAALLGGIAKCVEEGIPARSHHGATRVSRAAREVHASTTSSGAGPRRGAPQAQASGCNQLSVRLCVFVLCMFL